MAEAIQSDGYILCTSTDGVGNNIWLEQILDTMKNIKGTKRLINIWKKLFGKTKCITHPMEGGEDANFLSIGSSKTEIKF